MVMACFTQIGDISSSNECTVGREGENKQVSELDSVSNNVFSSGWQCKCHFIRSRRSIVYITLVVLNDQLCCN